jgi:hypothetical protein
MRVECIRIVNSVTNEPEKASSWLTLNKAYDVICMTVSDGHRITGRILSDDNSLPIIVDLTQFRLISDRIPSNWRINIIVNERVDLAPRPWLASGFWDDFFNGVKSAEDSFRQELDLIISESNDPD